MRQAILRAAMIALLTATLLACAPNRLDEICSAYPQWTAGQRSCAAAVLEARGIRVGSIPACLDIETDAQCLACADFAAIDDEAASAVWRACGVTDDHAVSAPSTNAFSPRSDSSADSSPTSASVRVGPDGVEIRGSRQDGDRGASISIGGAGLEIRGRGDGVPRTPVATCEDLCRRWPGVGTRRAECAATVLTALDYPIAETPACIDVETRGGCLVCSRTLALSDGACRDVYERCFVR